MPAGIAVLVECLANNRAGDVGIAVYVKVRARRVEGRRKISRRGNVDRLSDRWISRTDSIELKVPRYTALVNNVLSFYADVTVEIDFDVHIRFDVDAASDVAGHVNVDIGLGAANLIDREIAA